MRAALLQLNSSDDPAANLPVTLQYLREAAAGGARLALTPEVTNCVSSSRAQQDRVLQHEDSDQTLAALRDAARNLGIWVHVGSLALKTQDKDGRFANRSFMIGPDGAIIARYDKIHMFDVQVSETESYRESAGFRPGSALVTANTDLACIGLSVCYDLRFAYLYRALAQAGAEILTVPAAFSPVTGAAHWEILLRARAIETGCFVLAPAQTGQHPADHGQPRRTYGHSMAIAPWGEVLLDMGTGPGVGFVTIDLDRILAARNRIPSLFHDRPFEKHTQP
ncbi:carbon-nitrogen hydrolase family protein [Roseinatronobacter alkalisoli]|uniref:Carbon-nitrogen hydrolase family protein n=1 Tax=Roseinatronobacter alkalisoli TaxID=3028235 RepID=A0ABT5T6F3_9RHOB|nr:carbon-nitrogen hydrolase family protein [Roseinatronobacter sp. HJB301]MDD7970693.1 carbon-nitrogen hydrolase family protein [Roseinatronobacter sp. HJB301]